MRPTALRILEAIAATAWSETPNLSPTIAVEGRPSHICDDLDTNGINWLYLGSVREIKLFDVDRLLGIKRRGHSLGLALRVVTVPGGDSQRIGNDWPHSKRRGWDCPEPVAAIPCWAPWWAMPSSPNLYQYLMGSLSLVVEANSSTRYMLINTPNTFHTVSPFLVQKLLTSCIDEIQNVKKLRSGDLLVQVDSKQASVISKLTHLGTFPVETSFHKTLNVSRGVLSNPDFIHVTEAEFLEELRDQNVCAARRINIRRDGRLIPTQHVVLTFQTPVLPKSIKAGYINCKLRPYIPNPLRCFKCQRYGHSQQSCRGTDPVCGKCAESGPETNVCPSDTFKCRNCSGPHAASSKSCPTWIFEKEVIAVKIKRNITLKQEKL
ncbi:hypothetical protein AVEN_167745-1 [Araneus ventricosus]|uniref:CCHC-type domain-containing protein n=1 Tax=Araneus ventricosus TaxID=182803 RepID=A0A4Y2VSH5_ARAVE|nr:hypothetical protein AVEN_164500-1 [Araneus ventricosus]GBO28512.1 hypothetical protein AVEN_167745-1 [Araneus ventricosus]